MTSTGSDSPPTVTTLSGHGHTEGCWLADPAATGSGLGSGRPKVTL